MTLKSLPELTSDIEKELSAYSPILQRLLINRGITKREDAYRFLFPSFEEHVYDPFLLKDMEKAIDRLYTAIQKKEKVAVYADYDCDGVPGSVIMNDFFLMLGYTNYVVYIPDRHKEGYGLQKSALKGLIENDGVTLIITVDLGITNVQEVAYCMSQGVDVIVTDHHLTGTTIPPAFAVINPKQDDCHYPDPMLCGSGVAFKFVQAFLEKYRDEFGVVEGQEKWLMDMVGLATLSDMVPLVNENRVFAYYGLIVFKKTRRKGLLNLLKKAGVQLGTIVEDDITFMVSPRINAAGRMDHPRHAFDLLATKDSNEALEKSNLLHQYNLTRKNLVKTIMKKAKAKVADRKDHEIIVVGDRDWSPGILGLVASRLVEEYKKPVFVWGGSEEDTILKGSCRSDGSVNMVSLMEKCQNSFETFGGHELAGGFAISLDQVHFLEEKLSEVYKKIKKEMPSEVVYDYDTTLTFDDVTDAVYKDIQKMAPFGVGNSKPIFFFRDSVIKTIRLFGKANEHLELSFQNSTGKFIKAIAFFTRHDSFDEPLEEGKNIQLFASIEKSYFGYKTEVRLKIHTIYIS